MNKLLKTKAIVMIILVISITFYTSLVFKNLNNNQVSQLNINKNNFKFNYFSFIKQSFLPEVNAQTKVCCELTKQDSIYSGQSCVFTEPTDCDTSLKPDGTPYQTSGVACPQTDFCAAGVCILGGTCEDNVEKGLCLQNKGVFRSGTSDQISQCRVGCCDLPSGASLTTDAQCSDKVKVFPDLKYSDVFKPDITDQVQCLQQSRSSEEGCCVLPDQCTFGTRSECNDKSGEFKLNNLCSNPSLGCQVTAKHSTICYQNKVYWTDSSNNRENVYDGKFDESWQYTNWLVQTPDQVAKVNPQSIQEVAESGNCQFSLGSSCNDVSDVLKTYLKNNKNLQDNDVNKIKNQCISVNCLKTQVVEGNSWTGGPRQNGESWCEYQSKTGNGEDLVGTRQFIHSCTNGVEKVTECAERRKEICIQNDVPASVTGVGKDLTYATCAPNNWQLCLESNKDTESCGFTLNEAITKYNLLGTEVCKELQSVVPQYNSCVMKTVCRQDACESQVLANCYFNKDVGLCAPSVPPGTLGKEDVFTELTDGDKIGFSFDAKMYLVETATLGANPEFKADCKAGCDINTNTFADKWNNYCTSLGDLGAKYNIAGKYSKEGFWHGGPFDYPKDNINFEEDPAADGVSSTPKPFSYYISNILPLMGNIYSLLDAVSKLKIINFEQGTPKDLEGHWKDIELWLISGGIVGAGAGALLALGAFATTSFAVGANGVIFTGNSLLLAQSLGLETQTSIGFLAINPFIVAGIIIVAIIIINWILNLLFGAEKADLTYKIQCGPWTPPDGGNDCKICNDKSKFNTCDEYTCKSLGKACDLLNKGNPGNETCVWANRNTVPPIIGPYIIPPFDEGNIEKVPPSTGYTGGYKFRDEITAFTSIETGIKIINDKGQDDYAECKISKFNTFDYNDPNAQFFDDSLTKSMHKRRFTIAYTPILPEEDRIELEAGKVNTFYIKCKGPNGQINQKPYFIEIPISKGPDTAPPEIKSFSIKNNAFIPYNLNQTLLTIYVEDQSGVESAGGCKYSTVDQNYDVMPYNLTCSNTKVNPEGQFACTTLLNLKPNQDNTFYFRCKDLAKDVNGDSKPNVNPKSMPPVEGDTSNGYHLLGTQPLEIIDTSPTGEFIGTDVNLTINTNSGAENGKATCWYAGGEKSIVTKDLTFSPSGIKFASTDATNHETTLSLLNERDYLFYVWCRDIAGNEDSDVVEFHTTTPDLFIDDVSPNGETFFTDQITLTATTSGGIKGNGDATCSYNGDTSGYFNEGKEILGDKTIQTKNLTLVSSGITYNLTITCTDQFKDDSKQILFTVNFAEYPQITRLYTSQNLLNVLLNNPSDCKYSTTDPKFDYNLSTTKMVDVTETLKQVQISSSIIYLQCKDTRTDKLSPTYTIYP